MQCYALGALALVLASTSSVPASPLNGLKAHLFHPTIKARPRLVDVVFDSQTIMKRRVQMGHVTYILPAGRVTRMSVPIGTAVIARSAMRSHADGQTMLIAGPEKSSSHLILD